MGQRQGTGASCTGLAHEGQDMANGQALVIVGESTLEQAVDKAELKADKHVAKELNTSAEDIDKAVQEAATEVS